MSKDKKQKNSLSDKIKEIDEDLDTLSHETNLNVILAKYTEAQNKINNTEKTLKEIRLNFDTVCEKEIQSQKSLTDNDFGEYIKLTEQEITEIENYSLEKQIEKYEKICKRLACCKKYLQSKKMEIVKCDDEIVVGHSTTSSESS
jgi:hypothetical protein